MIRKKGLNYVKFHMEVSSRIKKRDWTGENDKWLEFDVCMIDTDNKDYEPHFNIMLHDNSRKEHDITIAEEVSIKQLIDLHSFIGCVLKMKENK